MISGKPYSTSLRALADPTRQVILERIARNPCRVGKLEDWLPVSQPAVLQHLEVLRKANLVSVRKQGNARIYSLKADGLAEVRDHLDRFWTVVLDSFAEGFDDNENRSASNRSPQTEERSQK